MSSVMVGAGPVVLCSFWSIGPRTRSRVLASPCLAKWGTRWCATASGGASERPSVFSGRSGRKAGPWWSLRVLQPPGPPMRSWSATFCPGSRPRGPHDQGGCPGVDPGLSALDLSIDPAILSLYANVLFVCRAGHRAIRRVARRMVGHTTTCAMPSLLRRGLRPGARASRGTYSFPDPPRPR